MLSPFLKPLLGFTLMSFIGTVLLNYIEIDLRTLILERISVAEAGSWTAMNSISKIYMQFITIIFPIYILPKYAVIKTSFEFRKEVFQIYKTLFPLVITGMLLVYFSRNILIQVIYTKEFLGMASLFKVCCDCFILSIFGKQTNKIFCSNRAIIFIFILYFWQVFYK